MEWRGGNTHLGSRRAPNEPTSGATRERIAKRGVVVDIVLGQLFAGVSQGSILLLIALGLALTFGQMGVINMAHGEFIMAGAYTCLLYTSPSPRDRS